MGTIEDVTSTLIHGVDLITHLLHAVCIVIGFVLWIMAFGFWKAHQYNPKQVPLDKPIVYLMLGFVLVGIPFLNRLLPTGNSLDFKQPAQTVAVQVLDIDTPLKADLGVSVFDIDAPLEGS